MWTWYLRYSLGGKQVRESTHTRDEQEARKVLKRRQAELTLGLALPEATNTKFDELSKMVKDDFKANNKRSWPRTEDALQNLARRFSGWRVVAITTDQITQYQRLRQKEGAANSTVNRETSVLRRAFHLGRQAGKVALIPHFPKLQEAPPRSGFFEPAEFEAVRAGLPDYLQAPVTFLYLTGWRRSEVLGLTWRQVDFAAKTVRLEPGSTKNHEGRVFPFSSLPALGDLLRHQRERTTALERETGQIVSWVFHRHGRPILGFRKAWATACKAAGLVGKIPHDFRRTAARNLVRSGVPERVAMAILGHKSRSVFDRYHIVNERDLAEGVAKLARLHQAQAGAERRVVPLPGAARARGGQTSKELGKN